MRAPTSAVPTPDPALASLLAVDPSAPVPAAVEALAAPDNRHLLEYVREDPFGAHVFPGNIEGYDPERFLDDLDEQLRTTPPIHLWAYIPTCSYRCRFCQYPVVVVKGPEETVARRAAQWVDWNIREARLWLRRVPHLASAPVGEFNVFGGTPSLLPAGEIRRLLDFYREHFAFGPDIDRPVRGRSHDLHGREAGAARGTRLHQGLQWGAVVRRSRVAAERA
ncbi:hypothetical protein SANTM175S_08385 [Streptomyces antimycoticus]